MPAYDFQYFLPQEFLSDLPLREGSFGAEVIQYLLMANFQDLHNEKVDSGWFYDAYATLISTLQLIAPDGTSASECQLEAILVVHSTCVNMKMHRHHKLRF